MSNYNRIFWFLVTIILTYCTTVSAQTDSIKTKSWIMPQKPWPITKYSVHLGAFGAVNTTKLGASVNGKDYTIFDFEDDLKMSRNTYSVLFNFNARFGKHNRVDFSYYNIYRSKTTTINKEIEFGGHTYPVNSDIGTHLNTNIFRLSYGYAFISNPKLEVGALIGFHVLAFNIGFDYNGQTLDESYRDNVVFTAPLPDFGFFGTYAFNKRWAANAELSSLYVKYKDLKGRIQSASLAGQYRLSDRWEVDLGYSFFDVLVKLDRQRLDADFKWGYNGPFASVAYKF